MESRVFLDSFTLAWEQRKFGEMASSFEYGLNAAAKEYDGENKYIRITDIDDNTREFVSDSLTSPDIDLTDAEKYKLSAGDILFARTGASVGKSYIYRDNDGLVYYAGFLIRASINDEYDAEFVFQNTLTDKYKKYITVTSQRSGQPGVNAQEYSEYKIQVPKKEEQIKIGKYFRNIDKLITLHQCKESAFSEWKDSGFLQKHKTTWEQRKAKELCSISTGKSNTQDRIEDGKYPFYVRSPIVERSNRYLFDEEAVLTVGDGVGTGKVFHYVNGKYDLHQRVYRMFGFSEEISAKYFYYYFSNHFYDRVMAMTAKTSVDSVRYEMIADMEISLPNKQEQICISMLFEQLDNLITLHQRKPFCINRRQKWKQTTKMQNYSANIMQNGFQYIRKGR